MKKPLDSDSKKLMVPKEQILISEKKEKILNFQSEEDFKRQRELFINDMKNFKNESFLERKLKYKSFYIQKDGRHLYMEGEKRVYMDIDDEKR